MVFPTRACDRAELDSTAAKIEAPFVIGPLLVVAVPALALSSASRRSMSPCKARISGPTATENFSLPTRIPLGVANSSVINRGEFLPECFKISEDHRESIEEHQAREFLAFGRNFIVFQPG